LRSTTCRLDETGTGKDKEMNTEKAIRTRNSVRAFLPKQVDPELIQEVLELSMMAPSACNLQPFRIAVASGGMWRMISSELCELARKLPNQHDIPWELSEYPERYKNRQRKTGFGLYKTLGIERGDKEGRKRQYSQNFKAFGAPAVVFVFTDKEVGEYATLDVGAWMQTFMLAAHEKGLATVAQTSLVAYPQVLRKFFDVPEHMSLVCAISFGYADPDAVVNTYRPQRAPLQEMLVPLQDHMLMQDDEEEEDLDEVYVPVYSGGSREADQAYAASPELVPSPVKK